MFSYKIKLKVTAPTSNIPTDFNDRRYEIEEAMGKFNRKYLGIKKLSIIELSDIIIINLETKDLVDNPTREFNTFSSYLKKEHHWNQFTKEKYRLFDATILEKPDVIPIEREKTTIGKVLSIKSTEILEELKKEHLAILHLIDFQMDQLKKGRSDS